MKKAVFIILDGFGIAPPTAGNAIAQAKKPNLDKLFAEYPCTQLQASGLDVGLPEGQMGNSEVGHTNIGAGRVVFQILPKISQEIRTGKFFENKVKREESMKEAIYHFPTDGKPMDCRQIKSGHIHQTYLITTNSGAKYILQWINQYVFPNVNANTRIFFIYFSSFAKRTKVASAHPKAHSDTGGT